MSDDPVVLPPSLAEALCRAVEKFAISRGLRYECWYHDMPLWFVIKEYKTIDRLVQISGYVVGAETLLFFLPSGSRAWTAKYTVKKPITEIMKNNDIVTTLELLILRAWKKAKKSR